MQRQRCIGAAASSPLRYSGLWAGIGGKLGQPGIDRISEVNPPHCQTAISGLSYNGGVVGRMAKGVFKLVLGLFRG